MRRAPLLLLLLALAATSTTGGARLPVEVLPAHGATLRIALIGDVGEGSDRVARGVAIVHAQKPLDAILLLGDNFYPNGVRSLTDPRWSRIAALLRIRIPIYPLVGNHDGNGSAEIAATGTINHWRFPASEYVVHSPLAEIAMLDTNAYATGASRTAEQTIHEAFSAPNGAWRIVAGHHTIVSSGFHGYWPRDEHRRMGGLLQPLREVHADLYVCGHDHHQEFLATNPPMLVSGAGSDPVPPVALHLATRFPPEIRREPIGFSLLEITARAIAITIYDAAGRPRFHTEIVKSEHTR